MMSTIGATRASATIDKLKSTKVLTGLVLRPAGSDATKTIYGPDPSERRPDNR